MSRPLRTVLILLAMGVAATVALAVMAGRLRTRVAPAASGARPPSMRQVVPAQPDRLTPEGEARVLVAGFLKAQRAIARGVGEGQAREGAGLSEEDYLRVRAAYREWREGRRGSNPLLLRALEARRGDLEALQP